MEALLPLFLQTYFYWLHHQTQFCKWKRSNPSPKSFLIHIPKQLLNFEWQNYSLFGNYIPKLRPRRPFGGISVLIILWRFYYRCFCRPVLVGFTIGPNFALIRSQLDIFIDFVPDGDFFAGHDRSLGTSSPPWMSMRIELTIRNVNRLWVTVQ